MKYILNFLIAGLFLLCVNSCKTAQEKNSTTTAPSVATATFTQLAPNDFEQKLASATNALLLDVRTEKEHAEGHLNNSTLLDYFKPNFEGEIKKLDRDKPIFLYCASGGRSEQAAELLVKLGFSQVYEMKGGYEAWAASKQK